MKTMVNHTQELHQSNQYRLDDWLLYFSSGLPFWSEHYRP